MTQASADVVGELRRRQQAGQLSKEQVARLERLDPRPAPPAGALQQPGKASDIQAGIDASISPFSADQMVRTLQRQTRKGKKAELPGGVLVPQSQVFSFPARVVMNNLPSAITAVGTTAVGLGVAGVSGNLGLGIATGALTGASLGALGKSIEARLFAHRAATNRELFAQARFEGASEGAGALGGELASKVLLRPNTGLLRMVAGRQISEAAMARQTFKDLFAGSEDFLIAKGFSKATAERVTKEGFAAAEVTDGHFLDFLDNFITSSTVFGEPRSEFIAARNLLIDHALDSYVSTIGPELHADDLARLVGTGIRNAQKMEMLNGSSEIHAAIARRLRTRTIPPAERPSSLVFKGSKTMVSERVPAPAELPKSTGIDAARKARFGANGSSVIVEETGGLHGLVRMKRIKEKSLRDWRGWVNRFGSASPDPERLQSITKGLESVPDLASFDEIRKWRSALGEAMSLASGPNVNKQFSEAGGRLYSDLTTSMRSALREYDLAMQKTARAAGGKHVSAELQWLQANDAHEAIMSKYNKDYLNKLVKYADDHSEPGKGYALLGSLFKPGAERKLRDLRRIVGSESDAWRGVQRHGIERLIEAASTQGRGLSGQRFAHELSSGRSFGSLSTKELFGESRAEQLTKLASAIELSQRKNNAPGSMLVQFTEAGIAMRIMRNTSAVAARQPTSGGFKGFLASYTLSQVGLRKVLMSADATKALMEGINVGPRGKMGFGVLARIVAPLAQDDLIEIPESETREEYTQRRRRAFR